MIGEISTRTFERFVGRKLLYLETEDNRLFVHPYGPLHDDAIGRIYKVIPGGAGPEDSEHTLGYVKSLLPKLPKMSHFPIEVKKEMINEQKGIVKLEATIKFNKHWTKEVIDTHEMDGKGIEIELFLEDTKLEYVDRLHAAT